MHAAHFALLVLHQAVTYVMDANQVSELLLFQYQATVNVWATSTTKTQLTSALLATLCARRAIHPTTIRVYHAQTEMELPQHLYSALVIV